MCIYNDCARYDLLTEDAWAYFRLCFKGYGRSIANRCNLEFTLSPHKPSVKSSLTYPRCNSPQ